MDLKVIALRCPACRTLFEVPSVEAQDKDIQETFANIIGKLKFPCPDCGRYIGFSGPLTIDDLR